MAGFFIWLLQNYTRICLNLYFCKFQIRGKKNIPGKGPLIFAVNHQNAFLDAVLIACSSPRFPYFLARADVFRSSIARFFLHWLHIMPIYRFRDGLGEVRKSLLIIEKCIELLKTNEAVLIFPEGNHNLIYSLRPLQKGIARMAYGSQKSLEAELKIVPVGIQYENHTSYGSRVLISYGQPIAVRPFLPNDGEPSKEDKDKFLAAVYDGMLPLLFHIPEDNYEEIYDNWKATRIIHADLVEQLESDQKIVRKMSQKNEHLVEKVTKLNPGKYAYFFLRSLLKTIFIVPYLIIKLILKRTIEDPVFLGPMQFSWSMIFYPFFFLGFAYLILILTHSWIWSLGFLVIIPLILRISAHFKPASMK